MDIDNSERWPQHVKMTAASAQLLGHFFLPMMASFGLVASQISLAFVLVHCVTEPWPWKILCLTCNLEIMGSHRTQILSTQAGERQMELLMDQVLTLQNRIGGCFGLYRRNNPQNAHWRLWGSSLSGQVEPERPGSCLVSSMHDLMHNVWIIYALLVLLVGSVSSYFCSLYFLLIPQDPSPQSWCSPPCLCLCPTCAKTRLQITCVGFKALIFCQVNNFVIRLANNRNSR